MFQLHWHQNSLPSHTTPIFILEFYCVVLGFNLFIFVFSIASLTGCYVITYSNNSFSYGNFFKKHFHMKQEFVFYCSQSELLNWDDDGKSSWMFLCHLCQIIIFHFCSVEIPKNLPGNPLKMCLSLLRHTCTNTHT